jgi:hypothetical protein
MNNDNVAAVRNAYAVAERSPSTPKGSFRLSHRSLGELIVRPQHRTGVEPAVYSSEKLAFPPG